MYAVLLLIGVSLSRVEDLGSRLDTVAVCLYGQGEPACFGSVGKVIPWRIKGKRSVSVGVSGSVGQLGCVLLGFAFS